MKLSYTLTHLLLLGLLITACNTPMGVEKPKGSVPAGAITDAKVDNSHPGQMVLRWQSSAPKGTDILYVRAEYHDPYTRRDVVRLGSTLADSIVIPNTYVAGGEYSFRLTPFSTTLAEGTPVTITGTSTPVPVVTTVREDEIELTADDLSSNAPEPSPKEGNLADALDRNENTYFHTEWHGTVKEVHHLQFRLREYTPQITVKIIPRKGKVGDVPRDVTLYTSPDGETWTALEGSYTFPKESKLIPLYRTDKGATADDVAARVLTLPEGTAYVRIASRASHRGKKFFNLAELYVYKYSLVKYDREAEGKEVIEGKADPKPDAK